MLVLIKVFSQSFFFFEKYLGHLRHMLTNQRECKYKFQVRPWSRGATLISFQEGTL